MENERARQFAEEVFASAPTVEAVIVVTDVFVSRRSSRNARPRMHQLLDSAEAMVRTGNADAARAAIESASWEGAALLRWCASREQLREAIGEIYAYLIRQRKHDGYDYELISEKVAKLAIWID
jgi:hypothetical protein